MYYDGEYENGVYHGAGQFAEEDGSLYCGSWSKGLRCGQGSLPSLYYCNIWSGVAKAARSTTGSATSTHPAPKIPTACWYRFDAVNRYQGSFLDDLYHGAGKCTWVNGSVYDGAWIMGNPNGIGLCDFAFHSSLKCESSSHSQHHLILPLPSLHRSDTSQPTEAASKVPSSTALPTVLAPAATKTTTSTLPGFNHTPYTRYNSPFVSHPGLSCTRGSSTEALGTAQASCCT